MIAKIENNRVIKIYSGDLESIKKFDGGSEFVEIDKPFVVGDPIDKDFSKPIESNDVKVEELSDKEIAIKNHLNYLFHTDWYVIRFAETGKEIPEEILKLRALAREEISKLRG